jgi:hypothetical protein
LDLPAVLLRSSEFRLDKALDSFGADTGAAAGSNSVENPSIDTGFAFGSTGTGVLR